MKKMTMKTPATRWEDALPCGNGTTGAMVYGNIREEMILINREELYYRALPKPAYDDVSVHLPKTRELLEQGRYREAEEFYLGELKKVFKATGGSSPFQPFCDLHITQETGAAFTDYERILNFETGQATVSWSEGANNFTRRLFVPLGRDLILMSITGTAHVSANFALEARGTRLADGMGSGNDGREQNTPWRHETTLAEPGEMTFTAYLPGPDGKEIPYEAAMRIIPDKGTMSADGSSLTVTEAREILVIIKTKKESPWPEGSLGYETLFGEHKDRFSGLFNRMVLELGRETKEGITSNEQLLLDAYPGEVSTELIEKMHDYGRYLLITSSITGAYPANLQGLWNGDYRPAWSSDFHNDENIQMNYWAAPMGNLTDTMLPLFNFYDSFKEDYRENARKMFGCRGFLLPICHTTNGMIYKPTIWDCWTGAGAWIAQHYYDYWLYTGDRNFLGNRALPFLREVCLFYLDFFYKDAEGRLISAPSLSPENKPAGVNTMVCLNGTMDFALAREALTNYLAGLDELGVQDEEKDNFRSLLNEIPSYEINEDGALKEWMYPGLEDNYHQRHQSHLYPIFPGREITRNSDTKLFEACRAAVEKRLVLGLTSQTGWSLAHMANIYARLGEGNRALDCLELLCRSTTGPNLFTYHNDWRSQGITMYWGPESRPPFQIDANFGITSAVLEMLIFSDGKEIRLLPALPDKWRNGSLKGVLCRGGYTVDLEWKEGRLEKAEISKADWSGAIRISHGETSLTVTGPAILHSGDFSG